MSVAAKTSLAADRHADGAPNNAVGAGGDTSGCSCVTGGSDNLIVGSRMRREQLNIFRMKRLRVNALGHGEFL